MSWVQDLARRRAYVGAEDTQSQGLGFTPPDNVVTFDPGTPYTFIPSPAKALFDKAAAEESSRRKRALDLESVKRWAEASQWWTLAASSADNEAAIEADRPDLNLEPGTVLTCRAACRAADYRRLAERDNALASGVLLGTIPFIPIPPDPTAGGAGTVEGEGFPTWTLVAVGAGALYILWRFLR